MEKKLAFSKSYHDIKRFYGKRYSVEIPLWNESETLFFMCYDELRGSYSTEIQKLLHQHYLKIPRKNLKMRIVHFCSMTRLTFKLYMILRGF